MAPEQRTWREALVELLGLMLVLFSIVAVPVSIVIPAAGLEALWPAIVTAGATLYADLGWALGIYVATLLAFYIAVVGGQLIGTAEESARTRRILGAVALFMAASTLVLVLFVVVYMVSEPSKLPSLVVILPVAGIVVFLALHLGRFLVFRVADRYLGALRRRSIAVDRLSRLRSRSTKPVSLVLVLNLFVLTLVPIAVSVVVVGAVGAIEAWAMLLLLYGVTAIGAVGSLSVALYVTLQGTDKLAMVLGWIIPAGVYAASIHAAWIFLTLNDGQTAFVGYLIFGILLASLVTVFGTGVRKASNWTVRGATTTLVARSFSRSSTRASREIQRILSSGRREISEPRITDWLLDGIESFRSRGHKHEAAQPSVAAMS